MKPIEYDPAELEELLAERLNAFGTAPYLFVGSGIARRYLNLPTWVGLLEKFAADAGREFDYYNGRAESDLPQVATYIAEDFYTSWWDLDQYEKNRIQYRGAISSSEMPLKIEVAEYIKSLSVAPCRPEYENEINELRAAVVDGVVTTNWDFFLETIFEDFKVYATQSELIFTPLHSVGEIYKIHGCCSRPDSLVLTAADYKDYRERNAYLAAKLSALFVEHPIIFLGYSLGDENVRGLLSALAKCLTESQLNELGSRIWFVKRHSASQPRISTSLLDLGTGRLPATIIETQDFGVVYRAMGDVQRRFSARLLRQLKEQVYELVRTNDPEERLHVVDMDEADSSDIEVVFGVGVVAQLGYRRIGTDEIIADVLDKGRSRYVAQELLGSTIAEALRGPSKWIPVHRYLAGLTDTSSLPRVVVEAAERTRDYFEPSSRYYQAKKASVRASCSSVADVVDRFGDEKAAVFIPLLEDQYIDLGDLVGYLQRVHRSVANWNGLYLTAFRRLVCLYDWLAFR